MYLGTIVGELSSVFASGAYDESSSSLSPPALGRLATWHFGPQAQGMTDLWTAEYSCEEFMYII